MDLILLVVAWGLFFVAERIYLALNASISVLSDWTTVLFFKPLHVSVGLVSFFTALFLIRMIMSKYGRNLFRSGALFPAHRLFGSVHFLLGLWMLSVMAVKYGLFTIVTCSAILAYDVSQVLLSARKKKRLQVALQQRSK